MPGSSKRTLAHTALTHRCPRRLWELQCDVGQHNSTWWTAAHTCQQSHSHALLSTSHRSVCTASHTRPAFQYLAMLKSTVPREPPVKNHPRAISSLYLLEARRLLWQLARRPALTPPETATSLRKALGIRLKLDQLFRTKDDWHHSDDQEQRVHTGDVSRSSSEVWNGGDTIHYERKEGRLMNFAGTAYIHSPL